MARKGQGGALYEGVEGGLGNEDRITETPDGFEGRTNVEWVGFGVIGDLLDEGAEGGVRESGGGVAAERGMGAEGGRGGGGGRTTTGFHGGYCRRMCEVSWQYISHMGQYSTGGGIIR